jgi:CRP/FNR family transcriptional regulator, cyclic AMP receptor protein
MEISPAALRRVPVLAALSEQAWNAVLARATRTSVRRRDFIYVPGDGGAAVFVVLRGRVRVLLVSDDGHEATTELLEPGDLFGEEALTDSSARLTAAQAWEDSQLMALPVPELRTALASESRSAWALAELMAERRRAVERMLDGLAFRDVGARLARCLVDLAGRYGTQRADGHIALRLRLTHQDLATLVCTTRETITLSLERFKQEDWIDVQGRAIVLCDLEALRDRAGAHVAEAR